MKYQELNWNSILVKRKIEPTSKWIVPYYGWQMDAVDLLRTLSRSDDTKSGCLITAEFQDGISESSTFQVVGFTGPEILVGRSVPLARHAMSPSVPVIHAVLGREEGLDPAQQHIIFFLGANRYSYKVGHVPSLPPTD